jgi:hypothetical protein
MMGAANTDGEVSSSRESLATTLYRLQFRASLTENKSTLGEPLLMAAADIGRGRSCQTAIYVRLANIITKKEEAMTIMIMVLTARNCARRGVRSSKA